MLAQGQAYTIEDIPIAKVDVFIPRDRDKAGHKELVESIRQIGLIWPVTVIRKADGKLELIKGQGRLEAHTKLGRSTIRAFVLEEKDVPADQKVIEWLVDNSVREKLSAIDKARLAHLDRQAGLGYEVIGKKYGMSQSTARQYADAYRKSSAKVVKMVESARLPFTHAKAIAEGLRDTDTQNSVAELVVEDGMSLNDAQAVVRLAKRQQQKTGAPLRIPELRATIVELKHQRGTLRSVRVSRLQRLEALKGHAAALAADAGFVKLVDQAGLNLLEGLS